MTTLMARELMMGIKDSVEDLAATFKRMAMLKLRRRHGPFSDEVRKTDSAVLGRSSPSILEFTFGTEERTVPQAAVLPQDSPVFFETAKAEHKRKKGKSMKISFSYSKLHRKEGKHHARTCKP